MSLFNSKQKVKVKMSYHNLSHTFSGSFSPGNIYPVLCTKVVPGDVFQIASNPDLRTMPLISPFFNNVRCDIRYFYCRNLLLWKNFDEFITGHDRYNQGTVATHVHPFIDLTGGRGTLQDYLTGAIDESTKYEGIDALPFRMYNMIYNEYYRDENVSAKATVNLTDGEDYQSDYYLRQGCYRKDYFTASFPFTQAGSPVVLPSRLILRNGHISSQRYVDANGSPLGSGVAQNPVRTTFLAGDSDYENAKISVADSSISPAIYKNMYLDPGDSMGVNIDVRDFRNANAIQTFLERSAINGNRYAEYMLTHFGVHTADNSSFRPQYLGGGETLLNVNPVEQNSSTSGEDQPLGTLAGKGRVSGVMGTNKKYFFREYGWIMAIMVIRPDAVYTGGINKQFFADGDRFDIYYNPAFQNVGMDEIKVREIAYPALNGVSPYFDPKDVFSYQERGFEYKTIPNTVHGEMAASGSLNYWMAQRNFSGLTSKPQFNHAFVTVNTSCLNGQAAVDKFPLFVGSIGHHVLALRPMQYRAKYRLQ